MGAIRGFSQLWSLWSRECDTARGSSGSGKCKVGFPGQPADPTWFAWTGSANVSSTFHEKQARRVHDVAQRQWGRHRSAGAVFDGITQVVCQCMTQKRLPSEAHRRDAAEKVAAEEIAALWQCKCTVPLGTRLSARCFRRSSAYQIYKEGQLCRERVTEQARHVSPRKRPLGCAVVSDALCLWSLDF